MNELNKHLKKAFSKLPYPDRSSVKPPAKHAAEAMIQNLHASGKSRKKLPERFIWHEGDIQIIEPSSK